MVLLAVPKAKAELGEEAMEVAVEPSELPNQMVVMRTPRSLLRASATAMALPSPPRMPCGAAISSTTWLAAVVRLCSLSIIRAASSAHDVQP